MIACYDGDLEVSDKGLQGKLCIANHHCSHMLGCLFAFSFPSAGRWKLPVCLGADGQAQQPTDLHGAWFKWAPPQQDIFWLLCLYNCTRRLWWHTAVFLRFDESCIEWSQQFNFSQNNTLLLVLGGTFLTDMALNSCEYMRGPAIVYICKQQYKSVCSTACRIVALLSHSEGPCRGSDTEC